MRLTVFTGSGSGPVGHQAAVRTLGMGLTAEGIGVVYGGGRVGLMGVLADAVLAGGGEVIGVMPRHLVDREIAHRCLTRLDVVATMHQRKARMAGLGDGFLALPGGAGTLEEFFEVWTWGQLGLHHKPTALFDPDDFYRPLLDQLDLMVTAGYLDTSYRDALGIVHDLDSLRRFLDNYHHPSSKWAAKLPRPTSDEARTAGSEPLVSVGWLCQRGDRLLCVRTRGREKFYLPGGKLEPGESLETALVREVDEELGVRLSDLRPAFSVTAAADSQAEPTVLTMHCFRAASTGTPRALHEIEEIAWLALDDSRAAPAVQLALRLCDGFPAKSDEAP